MSILKIRSRQEALAIQFTGDNRQTLIDFVHHPVTPPDRAAPMTIAESLKAKHRSRFDRQLAKLLEYEARGYSIDSLCEELAQILAEMRPPERASALQKLERSPLAKKPSMTKVINHYYQKQPKISANPYLLIPLPQCKTQSKKKSLEEEQPDNMKTPKAIR